MSVGYLTIKLPDGATLAYEVHGSLHIGTKVPIVLVCGMSSLRVDYERLTQSLSQTRPVLIYDHRGMGNSCLANNEDLSIEMLARDLAFLLHALHWKEVSICGYSMGGVVAQQLLVLPYHPTHPMQLEFRTTHLFLVATRSVVEEGVGIDYKPPPTGAIKTLAERKAGARRIIESTFDPKWIAENGARLERSRELRSVLADTYLGALTKGHTIQLQKFDFVNLLSMLPTDMKVLVIHGNTDRVIPRRCGKDIQARIRGAVFLESGPRPGQVPSLDFGHSWYEYFDIEVWRNVVNSFIDDERPTFIERLHGFPSLICKLLLKRNRKINPEPSHTET
ncbi:hypothetical protein C0992_006111 [Termitomyces sp. T32_za158]|nr:hypothetical protein C0992_006111 [Termitomyces sp. T32_za158]